MYNILQVQIFLIFFTDYNLFEWLMSVMNLTWLIYYIFVSWPTFSFLLYFLKACTKEQKNSFSPVRLLFYDAQWCCSNLHYHCAYLTKSNIKMVWINDNKVKIIAPVEVVGFIMMIVQDLWCYDGGGGNVSRCAAIIKIIMITCNFRSKFLIIL